MPEPKTYFVYIMTNRSKTLYTGMTDSLIRRVREHKEGTGSRFTFKYKLDRLVYFERFQDVHNAIEREKQIKGWLRIKKIALIVSANPGLERPKPRMVRASPIRAGHGHKASAIDYPAVDDPIVDHALVNHLTIDYPAINDLVILRRASFARRRTYVTRRDHRGRQRLHRSFGAQRTRSSG